MTGTCAEIDMPARGTQRDAGRLAWLDNAKALAILLVVLGHTHYVVAPLVFKNAIYAFHVPAFLMFTGYLLPNPFSTISGQTLGTKWISRFVIAYAVYSAVAVALWCAKTSYEAHAFISPLPAVWGAFYGVSGRRMGLIHMDEPLWFLPFLTTSLIAFWLCHKVQARFGIIAAVGFLFAWACFGLFYHGPRWPWSIELAGIGAAFLFIGGRAREFAEEFEAFARSPLRVTAAAFVMLAVFSLTSSLNGSVNINGVAFGKSVFLFFASAVTGTIALPLVSMLMPRIQLMENISRNSMFVFCTHIYLVKAAATLPLPRSLIGTQIQLVAIALAATLLCTFAASMIRPMLNNPRWL